MSEGGINTDRQSEAVVLLHGIARTNRSMAWLEVYLGAKNYMVFNLNYPSRSHGLRTLGNFLHKNLEGEGVERFAKLHFVTHSMGGIVVREFIRLSRPGNLGHVVMLAPPNQGSEVSDFLSTNFLLKPLFNALYGPAGAELQTGERGYVTSLPPADFSLGVIAGTRSLDPLSSLVIPGANDGKVSVESTKLPGMAAHLVLPVNHTFIMREQPVLRQVAHFLKEGCFNHV